MLHKEDATPANQVGQGNINVPPIFPWSVDLIKPANDSENLALTFPRGLAGALVADLERHANDGLVPSAPEGPQVVFLGEAEPTATRLGGNLLARAS
jgi:hypothetical protein